MKKIFPIFIIIFFTVLGFGRSHAEDPEVEPTYAWGILQPLGLHSPASVDTLLYNYYRTAIPTSVSGIRDHRQPGIGREEYDIHGPGACQSVFP